MSTSSASSLGTDALAPGIELVDRFDYRHHGIYLADPTVPTVWESRAASGGRS
jgi:hypothetical protein